MKAISNQQLAKKFVQMLGVTEDLVRKQAIYDSAYAYAITAGRDFVKFQPMFFMTYIENESGFTPEVSYGYQDRLLEVK